MLKVFTAPRQNPDIRGNGDVGQKMGGDDPKLERDRHELTFPGSRQVHLGLYRNCQAPVCSPLGKPLRINLKEGDRPKFPSWLLIDHQIHKKVQRSGGFSLSWMKLDGDDPPPCE